MTPSPRTVFGMPAYNRPDTLAETIESILGQTSRDFVLLIIDDAPTEATDAIIERYRRTDPRLTYERNPRRLGMIENWRKCFWRARERYPQSEFFAWVSDHDFWHPLWLELLVAEFDRQPNIVAAYPKTLRLYTDSPAKFGRSFETVGIQDPVTRLRLTTERLVPGDTIYGLFRVTALQAAGVFRPVLLPDRQVLMALAALGEFRQVPEVLWYRQIPRTFSFERQRASFFVGRAPLYTYLPPYLQHYAITLWDFVLCGRGGERLDRRSAFRAVNAQLAGEISRSWRRKDAERDDVTSERADA
jgi:glycosyltransferase involved in cell wall biosynthesis